MDLLMGKDPRDLRKRRFGSIQAALEYSHSTGIDLWEMDDGVPNLLYRNSWDTPMKRTTWRTLRSEHGLSPMERKALPLELRDGTSGPDFEVR